MNDDYWSVSFQLIMDDITKSECPCITGDIVVRGKNIFEVLQTANIKLKSFGYDRTIIDKAKRNDMQNERI